MVQGQSQKSKEKRGKSSGFLLPLGQSYLPESRTSVVLPSHRNSSSLHPILLFFNATTQHGFVAHSSIFLQAVFRAEIFCRTGWNFFTYLIVFNCKVSRTGCLGAAAAHGFTDENISGVRSPWCHQHPQSVQQGPSKWNCQARSGPETVAVHVQLHLQRAGRVFRGEGERWFHLVVPSSLPSPAGTGTLSTPSPLPDPRLKGRVSQHPSSPQNSREDVLILFPDGPALGCQTPATAGPPCAGPT